jgi:outer membrane protein OmpA-like peptidoglycan-associated protein
VTDPEKVGREKVAGLCILFEEGQYHVATQRPFTVTAAGAQSSWVLVKVQSDRDHALSQFGLELAKKGPDLWQVVGIDFSTLLQKYMTDSGVTAGVAYTPIIKTPSGGEKLVVYFDYNDSNIVPRAQRQLEIVAHLLKDDPNRKMRLSGHADALGSESYNLKLSRARAFNVRESLTRLGVNPAQVVSEGLGELQPMDPNLKADGTDNTEGRSRNRRTEIYLDF